jgi:malic enzyme
LSFTATGSATFNDDIQGTAVVAAGTLLSAVNMTRVPLKAHRIVVLGAGSAGSGISALLLNVMMAEGLSRAEARSRFFLVDRDGLLVDGIPDILAFQRPFVQSRSTVANWRLEQPNRVGLLDVARNAHPTVLIRCCESWRRSSWWGVARGIAAVPRRGRRAAHPYLFGDLRRFLRRCN